MQLTQQNPFGSEFPPYKNPLLRLNSLTVSSVVATTRPMFHCLNDSFSGHINDENGECLATWDLGCVRARTKLKSAIPPLLIQIFGPFVSALVLMPATSKLALGSVTQ